MDAQETLEALTAIGLAGELVPTGHVDYERIFALDADGVTQGRLTIYKGEYQHAKWYVEKINNGPVLSNERIPHAWKLWLQRKEPLSPERWREVVTFAKQRANEDRDAKQAWRGANPGPKRRPLQLNVRRFIRQELYPEFFATATYARCAPDFLDTPSRHC